MFNSGDAKWCDGRTDRQTLPFIVKDLCFVYPSPGFVFSAPSAWLCCVLVAEVSWLIFHSPVAAAPGSGPPYICGAQTISFERDRFLALILRHTPSQKSPDWRKFIFYAKHHLVGLKSQFHNLFRRSFIGYFLNFHFAKINFPP